MKQKNSDMAMYSSYYYATNTTTRQQEKLNMGLNHALTCCGKKLRS